MMSGLTKLHYILQITNILFFFTNVLLIVRSNLSHPAYAEYLVGVVLLAIFNSAIILSDIFLVIFSGIWRHNYIRVSFFVGIALYFAPIIYVVLRQAGLT